MDLSNIITQVLQSTQASNQRIMDTVDMLGKNAQQATAVNDANTAGAQADIPQAQALAQQQADVEAQRAMLVQSLQAATGLDPAQADNAYVTGVAQLASINDQRKQAYAQVGELSSVGLLDNPIGYILAQLKLPQVQAQAETLDKQATVVSQDVNTRLTLLANAKSTITANTAQQVKEIQLGQSELAAREARRKLAASDMENRTRIAGQYLQQVQLLDRVNDNTRQVYSMQMQAAQFEATMAERREARAERAQRMEAVAAAKKESDIEDQRMATGLASASTLLGYPQAVTVEMFKRMPNTPQKKRLAELAATGSLGDGLYDSFVAFTEGKGSVSGLKQGGNLGFAKFMEGVDRTVDDYQRKVANTPDKMGKRPSEKEAAVMGVHAYNETLIKSAVDPKSGVPLTSQTWDKEFNPYRQHLGLVENAVTAGKVKPLTGNAFFEALQAVATGSKNADGNVPAEGEQQAIRVVAKRVAARELNANDAAAQIAEYYRTSAAVNANFYQYTLAGLPVQDSYMAKVKVPGFFDHTTAAYNVMKPEQAKALLMEIVREDTRNAPAGLAKPPQGGFFPETTFKWIK